MLYRSIVLGSVIIVFVSLSLWAAEKHNGHTLGMNHSDIIDTATQPAEGGQATHDDKLDWETIDIDGLRAHLLDMNHLMVNTEATKSINGDSNIQFVVRGTTTSIPSIHRMVPAHSRFIEQSRGWKIEPELRDDGAKLTITVKDAATLIRLNALGFYGFMSLDSHHQAHHYQMAIGKSH